MNLFRFALLALLLTTTHVSAQYIDFSTISATGNLGSHPSGRTTAGNEVVADYPGVFAAWGNNGDVEIENLGSRGTVNYGKALYFNDANAYIIVGPIVSGGLDFDIFTWFYASWWNLNAEARVRVYGSLADATDENSQFSSSAIVPVSNAAHSNGRRRFQVTNIPSGSYVRIDNDGSGFFDNFYIDELDLNAGPLPVELVSFRSYVKDAVVELKWNTATELNNFGFHIERSIDAERWESIGFVPGFGTTASPKEYAFTDAAPYRAAEVSFYRLKQQDRDGTTDYSDVLRVMRPATDELSMRAWPLPFATQLSVEISSADARSVSLKLYNSAMQEVREVHTGHVDGSMTVTVPTGDLQAGTYFLVLHRADGPSQVRKLIHMGTR